MGTFNNNNINNGNNNDNSYNKILKSGIQSTNRLTRQVYKIKCVPTLNQALAGFSPNYLGRGTEVEIFPEQLAPESTL